MIHGPQCLAPSSPRSLLIQWFCYWSILTIIVTVVIGARICYVLCVRKRKHKHHRSVLLLTQDPQLERVVVPPVCPRSRALASDEYSAVVLWTIGNLRKELHLLKGKELRMVSSESEEETKGYLRNEVSSPASPERLSLYAKAYYCAMATFVQQAIHDLLLAVLVLAYSKVDRSLWDGLVMQTVLLMRVVTGPSASMTGVEQQSQELRALCEDEILPLLKRSKIGQTCVHCVNLHRSKSSGIRKVQPCAGCQDDRAQLTYAVGLLTQTLRKEREAAAQAQNPELVRLLLIASLRAITVVAGRVFCSITAPMTDEPLNSPVANTLGDVVNVMSQLLVHSFRRWTPPASPLLQHSPALASSLAALQSQRLHNDHRPPVVLQSTSS